MYRTGRLKKQAYSQAWKYKDAEIVKTYEQEKKKQQELSQDRQQDKEKSKDGFVQAPKQDTPFR